MSSHRARELARIAEVSNHPITVLPPEPIPTKPPGRRWMSKGGLEAKKHFGKAQTFTAVEISDDQNSPCLGIGPS